MATPGAVLEVDERNGMNALHIAVSDTHISSGLVNRLISAGADPDHESDIGATARKTAFARLLRRDDPSESVTILEELFPIHGHMEELGLTMVHKAVLGLCDLDLATLVEQDTIWAREQINTRDSLGNTPLGYAINCGDVKHAAILIAAGASVEEINANGTNPLHYIIHRQKKGENWFKMLDILLRESWDLNKPDPFGFTALHTAAFVNPIEAAKRLMAAGAAINQPHSFDGREPIHFAALAGVAGMVQLLYDHGADLEACNNGRSTPLLFAAYDMNGNGSEALDLLLDLGANHLHTDPTGSSILHIVAWFGHSDIMNTLAGFNLKGLDVSAKDAAGLTASERFEQRSSVTEELRSAFRNLLRSVAPVAASENGLGEEEVFYDAMEHLDE